MTTDGYSKNNPILPTPIEYAKPPANFTTSIQTFNEPLATFLTEVGLPTDGILASIAERQKVIGGLTAALESLPGDKRIHAAYLSKFTVAISVGLFDGALNYLWNETIAALRRLVEEVDLSYFYSIAHQLNGQYSRLNSKEDLDGISEHDLLETCRRMGLLTDVNYKRLEHINYMRNHASAAHPNAETLNGFELLSWLSNCLEHAITAAPEKSVITIKRLLNNIRTVVIPDSDYDVIGNEISLLAPPQIDNLLWTLFGMFTDPRLSSTAKANILGIVKHAWAAGSENRRYEIGARFGVFRKNGEVERKLLAEDFLKNVDGLPYRDDDSLAAELLMRLQVLKSAHYGPSNFYNEWPHAKDLEKSLPVTRVVPRAARPTWVKVLTICFIGNGHGYRDGTDEVAVTFYETYINNFSEPEIVEFIRLFADVEFNSVLDRPKPIQRARKMANKLKGLTDNIHLRRVLDEIISFPATLDKIQQSTKFQKLVSYIPQHT